MLLKTALTFLVVGALSVNALTAPVARSPAPVPESQELEAWMLKRDLSYELFSREPENWAEWAGFARNHYTVKRDPSPIWLNGPPKPAVPATTPVIHSPKPIVKVPEMQGFLKEFNQRRELEDWAEWA